MVSPIQVRPLAASFIDYLYTALTNATASAHRRDAAHPTSKTHGAESLVSLVTVVVVAARRSTFALGRAFSTPPPTGVGWRRTRRKLRTWPRLRHGMALLERADTLAAVASACEDPSTPPT